LARNKGIDAHCYQNDKPIDTLQPQWINARQSQTILDDQQQDRTERNRQCFPPRHE
jgi:hypothetical protein